MGNFIKKGSILIVDDEQVVLDVVTLMVKKLGYEVLQARNGREATQIFSKNNEAICLAILDMKLPDESGSDICKRLKHINHTVKVLHTSGIGADIESETLECDCDFCLPKPFKFEELSRTLKELLDENEGESRNA